MAERKAFISPYWAICAGCVLAAAFILMFTLAGCLPTYAQEQNCESADKVKISIRAMAGPGGPKLEEIGAGEKLERLIEYMKNGGLKAPGHPDGLLLIVIDNVMRMAWVENGRTCGDIMVSGEVAKEVLRVLADDAVPGRDA